MQARTQRSRLADESPRYSFSGHQTFPFRYAWLPKGVAAVDGDSGVFSQPDALVRLGVGKNMVASIRFWCHALGLIEFDGGHSRLTDLAKLLFGSVPARQLSTPPPPAPEPRFTDLNSVLA